MSSAAVIPNRIIAPKVYRAMKRDTADNLPVVGTTSSSELGARPGIDITVDPGGSVVLDGTGMSVAQYQTDLQNTRVSWQIDET